MARPRRRPARREGRPGPDPRPVEASNRSRCSRRSLCCLVRLHPGMKVTAVERARGMGREQVEDLVVYGFERRLVREQTEHRDGAAYTAADLERNARRKVLLSG